MRGFYVGEYREFTKARLGRERLVGVLLGAVMPPLLGNVTPPKDSARRHYRETWDGYDHAARRNLSMAIELGPRAYKMWAKSAAA